VLLELSSDQEFLQATTARFLDEYMPVGEVRRLRDDPVGFTADYWTRGANLGWISLLVSDAHGGGSVSGNGLIDLTLIALEFGRHAAPGPLVPTNVVAAALSQTAGATPPPLLARLLTGDSVATWCLAEPPPNDRLGVVTLDISVDGACMVLNGVKRPVESADRADYLLVTGRTGAGLTQVLVPRETSGLSVMPLSTVDLTRRFSTVTFDQVRVPADAVLGVVGQADEQVEHQLALALVLANAEAVGAMQAAFDMTLKWMFDRYSFGRPLASYQALKHRFADMKAWLEASHAIADDAAAAVASNAPNAIELVSAAKAFTGHYGSELLHECLQLHGGIGVTFEHDLHLFLRRHTVHRALYGTPGEHRQRIAERIIESENVAA
jgi:alkylation response protein AidB-like acyl-CoA dehydrogenase